VSLYWLFQGWSFYNEKLNIYISIVLNYYLITNFTVKFTSEKSKNPLIYIYIDIIIRVIAILQKTKIYKKMGNPKPLSSSGAKQAAEENGYKDEHDFKTSQGYGRSEADMCVDIDSDEIVLRPTGTSSTAVVETGMYTKAR
jgi:hypothetical protein